MKKLNFLYLIFLPSISFSSGIYNPSSSGGSSSGTISTGGTSQMAYYASSGTTVSGAPNTAVTVSSVTFLEPVQMTTTVVNGSFLTKGIVNTNAASYQVLGTDHIILASAPASGMTITLSSSSQNLGQVLVITKVDATTYPVTINGLGGEVIQGTGTLKLNAFMQTDQMVALGVVNGSGTWTPWGQGLQFTPDQLGPGEKQNTTSTINVASQPVCESFYTSVPVIIDSVTIINNGVVDPLVDVGIYDTGGKRMGSAGTFTPVLGTQRIPLTALTYLPPGIYWECLVCANTTSQFASNAYSTNMPPNEQSCTGAAGNIPLPATLPFPCNAARNVSYAMWAHVVGGAQ